MALCYGCGVKVSFKVCKDIYGSKVDAYGEFTKCPVCGICVYKEKVNKINLLYDNE